MVYYIVSFRFSPGGYMNSITINGITITGGRNISIVNGKVIVDGRNVTPDAKEINITVDGSVEKLVADVCEKISVTGNVSTITTQSGNVEITGGVNGSIQTMSGDVNCGNVDGNISTMSGDVKHRK
jgi:hypothetical protein